MTYSTGGGCADTRPASKLGLTGHVSRRRNELYLMNRSVVDEWSVVAWRYFL